MICWRAKSWLTTATVGGQNRCALKCTVCALCCAEWWYGETICRWVPYLQGVAVGASVNTLAAVAFERSVQLVSGLTTVIASYRLAITHFQ